MKKPKKAGAPDVRPEIKELLEGMARDLEELKGRELPLGSGPLFEDYAREWFERVYLQEPKKPGTIAQRHYLLRDYLLPVLSGVPVDAIRRKQIQAVRLHCKDLAPNSRNAVLVVLNHILSDAEEDELIVKRPRIRVEAVVRTKKPFHETATYLRIVAAARKLGRRYHLAVLLAGDAGMRASECAGLEWIRVDLKARTIQICLQDYKGRLIPVKNGRERTVKMTTALYLALSRVPVRQRVGRVILGARGGPIRRTMVSYLVDEATAAAGVTIAVGGAHTLRHSFVSHLAEAKAPVSAIQEMGGWQRLSTLTPYLHATEKSVEDAIRLLDAKRSRPPKK